MNESKSEWQLEIEKVNHSTLKKTKLTTEVH